MDIFINDMKSILLLVQKLNFKLEHRLFPQDHQDHQFIKFINYWLSNSIVAVQLKLESKKNAFGQYFYSLSFLVLVAKY